MKNAFRLAATAAASVAIVGATATGAWASPTHAPHSTGAVFAQTDAASGNAVVAYERLSDGTLRAAGTHRTGGKGAALGGSVVDHLASQGSLAEHGGRLYAVNAGSDTVTAFGVSGDTLSGRQVVSSGGDFPVSVTAHGSEVYVLNARGGGSIQGYRIEHGKLVKEAAWHRDLGFDPTATPEFTSTPAEISFTPNGKQLVVSTKGDGSSFETFAVGAGGPAAAPVVTAEKGEVPFGFVFDAAGHLVATEAGTDSAATFTVGSAGGIREINRHTTGQQATCWVAVQGKNVYVSNAGSGTISHYVETEHGHLVARGTTMTDAGTTDLAVSSDGKFLYAQTGAKGVIDVFAIARDGALTEHGSTTVPGAVGGEGIVAS